MWGRTAGVLAAAVCLALAPGVAVAQVTEKEPPPLGDNYFGNPRYDLTNGMEEYEGGFDMTNSNYLGSCAGAGVPAYAMSLLVIFVTLLILIFRIVSLICGTCFKCCKKCFKPMSYSNRDVKIMKGFVIIFLALSLVGCILIYTGGPGLSGAVGDTTDVMINSVLILTADVVKISEAFETVGDIPGLESLGEQAASLTSAVVDVDKLVKDNSDDIDGYLEQMATLFVGMAGAIGAVAIVGAVLCLIQFKRILLVWMLVAWLIAVFVWILVGLVMTITVVIDDLCTSMELYVEDPATSDLSSVIPCLDEETSLETMNMARSSIVFLVDGVNQVLELQEDLYGQYLDSDMDFICPAFKETTKRSYCRGSGGDANYRSIVCDSAGIPDSQTIYPANECPDGQYKNSLANFGADYAYLKCDLTTQEANSDYQGLLACLQEGKVLFADIFEVAESSATAADSLASVFPEIDGLIACKFVVDTFTDMTDGECDGLRENLYLLYQGFMMVAVVFFMQWITWLVALTRYFNPSYNRDKVVPK